MIANSNNLSSFFIQISKETRLELLSLGLESNPELKVSKFQQQIFLFSFEPKTGRKIVL